VGGVTRRRRVSPDKISKTETGSDLGGLKKSTKEGGRNGCNTISEKAKSRGVESVLRSEGGNKEVKNVGVGVSEVGPWAKEKKTKTSTNRKKGC